MKDLVTGKDKFSLSYFLICYSKICEVIAFSFQYMEQFYGEDRVLNSVLVRRLYIDILRV